MADKVGEQDIRGINIIRAVKGFADENSVLAQFVDTISVPTRENRWFQKTAGFLDSTDTTAITLSQLSFVGARGLPDVVGQSWTRNTSYCKKFFVESETISLEDEKDSDVMVIATTLRDLVRAINQQKDNRIYSVMIEAAAATPLTPNPTNGLTTAATADGWDDSVTGDPIKDLMTGNRKIRAQGYSTANIILYINPVEHENLMGYLINVKGSSIPSFSSDLVGKDVLMNILGNKVVVSQNATTDYAVQFIPQVSVTWLNFGDITSAIKEDEGIGKKIRVWCWGEAILTDPKSVHTITDTVV